ncbi:unnamed protein product, partial [Lymnaea stagnalis]
SVFCTCLVQFYPIHPQDFKIVLFDQVTEEKNWLNHGFICKYIYVGDSTTVISIICIMSLFSPLHLTVTLQVLSSVFEIFIFAVQLVKVMFQLLGCHGSYFICIIY